MIKNHKMVVIVVIVLFVGLSIGPVTANEFPENELRDEVVNIECALFDLDDSVTIEKFTLSEQELKELEVILSEFMEKIQSATDRNDVVNIIDTFFGNKHPVLSFILKPLNICKMFRNRAFVVSQGWSYKLNPFKDNSVETQKPFNCWYYSDQSKFEMLSRTFILRHGRLLDMDIECLHGTQIGMMTRFKGIYIYVARPSPEKSYTFFMGTTHHIMGLDFTLPDAVVRMHD